MQNDKPEFNKMAQKTRNKMLKDYRERARKLAAELEKNPENKQKLEHELRVTLESLAQLRMIYHPVTKEHVALRARAKNRTTSGLLATLQPAERLKLIELFTNLERLRAQGRTGNHEYLAAQNTIRKRSETARRMVKHMKG